MQGDLNMALHAVYGATKYIAVNADGSKAVSLQHVDGGEQDVAQFGNAEGQAVRLGNVADPVSDTDAVNKAYLRDNTVPAQGGAMTGNLDMGGNNIVNLKTPVNDNDATNKSYVDTELSETVSEIQSQIVQNSKAVLLGDNATLQDVIDNYDKIIFWRHSAQPIMMFIQYIPKNEPTGYNIAQLSVAWITSNELTSLSFDVTNTPPTETLLNIISSGEESGIDLYIQIQSGTESYNRAQIVTHSNAYPTLLEKIATPVKPNDAANKAYVDTAVASAGTSAFTVTSATTLSQIASAANDGNVIHVGGVAVDNVTYNGIAIVSNDGANITVICGDLYVRGTGTQTLANATTRWKFSEMINKTVLTALYS